MTSRKQVWIGIGAIALALLCLLYYSLERTAWLFELFEESRGRAQSAAIVVELAAVALLAGASVLDAQSRPWANRALLAILSVQALGNLSAGYLHGGRNTLALFGAGGWAAYVVAATLWLVSNLAIPGLILCLSKLLEQLLAKLGTIPTEERKTAPALRPALAHSKSVVTERASVAVADGACKYCHQTGLTAIEKARHGKVYKAHGTCIKV